MLLPVDKFTRGIERLALLSGVGNTASTGEALLGVYADACSLSSWP